MNIPEEAVEAALRVAIFEDCGDMSVLAAMVPEERAVWEENIRAELEAAAPYLYAQALRDFADSQDGWSRVDADFIREAADDWGPHE